MLYTGRYKLDTANLKIWKSGELIHSLDKTALMPLYDFKSDVFTDRSLPSCVWKRAVAAARERIEQKYN